MCIVVGVLLGNIDIRNGKSESPDKEHQLNSIGVGESWD